MSYTKTTWSDGDIITANKMNNIETGVESLNTDVGQLQTDLDSLTGTVENLPTGGDYQELVDDVADLKADLSTSTIKWERGNLNFSSSAPPTASSYRKGYRARTPVDFPIYAAKGTTFTPNTGFWLMFETYNATEGYKQSGLYTQKSFTLLEDSIVWVIIRSSSETGDEIPLDTIIAGITIDRKTTTGNIEADVQTIKDDLYIPTMKWERGNLTVSTSAPPTASSYNSNYRARTPVDSPLKCGAGTTIAPVSGYQFMLELYNETDGYLTSSWVTTGIYTVEHDSSVWLLVRASTESGDQIPVETLALGVTIVKKSAIDCLIKDYADNMKSISVLEKESGFSTIEFISRQGEFDGVTGNSIAGIKAAKANGYNDIRLSISQTADNYIVLSHGSTVTIGSDTYTIASTNYSVLSSVLELFDDAVLLCKRLGMKLVAEVKYGFSPETTISNAMDVVSKYGMAKSTTWSAWKSILLVIQGINPDASLALVGHLSQSVIDDAATLKNDTNFVRIDAYNVNHNPSWTDDYSDTNLIYAANKGLPIKVGSVYTKSDLLYWAGKVEIIEVANIQFPVRYLIETYLT